MIRYQYVVVRFFFALENTFTKSGVLLEKCCSGRPLNMSASTIIALLYTNVRVEPEKNVRKQTAGDIQALMLRGRYNFFKARSAEMAALYFIQTGQKRIFAGFMQQAWLLGLMRMFRRLAVHSQTRHMPVLRTGSFWSMARSCAKTGVPRLF